MAIVTTTGNVFTTNTYGQRIPAYGAIIRLSLVCPGPNQPYDNDVQIPATLSMSYAVQLDGSISNTNQNGSFFVGQPISSNESILPSGTTYDVWIRHISQDTETYLGSAIVGTDGAYGQYAGNIVISGLSLGDWLTSKITTPVITESKRAVPNFYSNDLAVDVKSGDVCIDNQLNSLLMYDGKTWRTVGRSQYSTCSIPVYIGYTPNIFYHSDNILNPFPVTMNNYQNCSSVDSNQQIPSNMITAGSNFTYRAKGVIETGVNPVKMTVGFKFDGSLTGGPNNVTIPANMTGANTLYYEMEVEVVVSGAVNQSSIAGRMLIYDFAADTVIVTTLLNSYNPSGSNDATCQAYIAFDTPMQGVGSQPNPASFVRLTMVSESLTYTGAFL